jgi:hypothetical protein
MKNNTIGVHYQTWKNRNMVNLVLKNFRKHYPEAPLRMVSDGGEKFDDLAKEYNCIFDYESENIYPKAVFVGHPNHKKEVSYGAGLVWLRRLYDTAKQFDTDWIILMEDDIFTLGRIKDFPNTNGAGATNPLHFTSELTQYLLNRNNVNTLYAYGMCGGAILDRQFFVEAYEKYINEFSAEIEQLCKLDHRVGGWTDTLITAFIIFCGGTNGVWQGTSGGIEGMWTAEDVSNINIHSAFLHGDKSLYTEMQGSLCTE